MRSVQKLTRVHDVRVVVSFKQRMAELKSQGATEQTSPELIQIMQFMKAFQKLVEWKCVSFLFFLFVYLGCEGEN